MDRQSSLDKEALTLSRGAASFQALVDWLDQRLADLALPPKAAYAMRLCVEEAVTNSYKFAISDEGGAHPIKVWAGLKDGAPAAWVEDDGPPFDPVAAILPSKQNTLDDDVIIGSGLRLMRHYAKRMNYRRMGRRNRLEFIFEANY